ncbi:MAG TPA: divalent-cation tolerance protein CutA [candidate division Zixibacteria bacterium]|jgi:periplasmic divalent cation tolerance protein
MANPEFAVVLSTAKSRREADTIARRLIADRAAACVNIVDKITSVYRWKGKVETSSEVLLIIKTRWLLVDQVQGTIKGFSSYECPEVLVLPVIEGSEEYLRWVTASTRTGDR